MPQRCFEETALRELYEELGLKIDKCELNELLTVRISSINDFCGELFHNEELCRVYSLKRDVDLDALTLQETELSEVRWFELSYILERIRAKDPLFCTDADEFEKIAEALALL